MYWIHGRWYSRGYMCTQVHSRTHWNIGRCESPGENVDLYLGTELLWYLWYLIYCGPEMNQFVSSVPPSLISRKEISSVPPSLISRKEISSVSSPIVPSCCMVCPSNLPPSLSYSMLACELILYRKYCTCSVPRWCQRSVKVTNSPESYPRVAMESIAKLSGELPLPCLGVKWSHFLETYLRVPCE